MARFAEADTHITRRNTWRFQTARVRTGGQIMGITFAEFLLGKAVRSKKTGAMLRIERVNSASDIVGRVLSTIGKDSAAEGAGREFEHLCFLDIDSGTLRLGA